MAQPLPTCALLKVALGDQSASIVVGHTATCARVVLLPFALPCIAPRSMGIRPLQAAFPCAPSIGSTSKASVRYANIFSFLLVFILSQSDMY